MKHDDKEIQDLIDDLLDSTKHSGDAEVERMILRLRRKHPRHVKDALRRKGDAVKLPKYLDDNEGTQ